jgi:dATP pyrophosphohydrolase
MARAPFQVLVYPFRKTAEGEYEYALMKRRDQGFWQAVAGGGEDSETPLQAAQRETWEETGIPPGASFIRLDTVEPIPVTEFRDSYLWGEDIYVIPQYCFGVLAQSHEIVLSREHSEIRWLSYEQAAALIRYDGNRTALWELDRRLCGKGPRR